MQAQSRAYATLLESDVALESGDVAGAIALLDRARTLADLWLVRYSLALPTCRPAITSARCASSTLCAKRRGEASAVFLRLPSLRYLSHLPYWHARAQQALGQRDSAGPTTRSSWPCVASGSRMHWCRMRKSAPRGPEIDARQRSAANAVGADESDANPRGPTNISESLCRERRRGSPGAGVGIRIPASASRPRQRGAYQTRGTSAWQSSQPVETQASDHSTHPSKPRVAGSSPAGRAYLIEGLRPSNSPTRSLAGTPAPRSARVAHSLRSFAAVPLSVHLSAVTRSAKVGRARPAVPGQVSNRPASPDYSPITAPAARLRSSSTRCSH